MRLYEFYFLKIIILLNVSFLSLFIILTPSTKLFTTILFSLKLHLFKRVSIFLTLFLLVKKKVN